MTHMKKLLPLAAALCLLLAACGGSGGDKTFDPEKTTQALLESGAFSVEPEQLDAALLYDFEGNGLDGDAVTESRAYAISGMAEQAAVLVCRDEDAAQQVEAMLKTYLADMEESYRNYAPAEVSKLEDAILERRDNAVLLVVANDPDAAREAVGL